jgi:putative FmdB family regulatory protein
VPLYEYRCRVCDETFEARRPMSQSSDPAECPNGHVDSRRVLSVFQSVGVGASSNGAPSPGPSVPMGGGGCGTSCGCHH